MTPKGTVQPKTKHFNVKMMSNPCDFLSSAKHKRRYFEKFQISSFVLHGRKKVEQIFWGECPFKCCACQGRRLKLLWGERYWRRAVFWWVRFSIRRVRRGRCRPVWWLAATALLWPVTSKWIKTKSKKLAGSHESRCHSLSTHWWMWCDDSDRNVLCCSGDQRAGQRQTCRVQLSTQTSHRSLSDQTLDGL